MIRNTPDKNIASMTSAAPAKKISVSNTPDTFEQREDAILKKTENKVKRSCGKCGFRFLYDPMKDYPQNCPNCGGSGRSHLVTRPVRR